MDANLQPPASSGRADTPPSGNGRNPVPFLPVMIMDHDERAARMLNKSPAIISWIRRNILEIGDTLVFALEQKPILLDEFLRKVHSIGANRGGAIHTPALELGAQECDQDEDFAQLRWHQLQTADALRDYVRAKKKAIAKDTEELLALESLQTMLRERAA